MRKNSKKLEILSNAKYRGSVVMIELKRLRLGAQILVLIITYGIFGRSNWKYLGPVS